MASVHNPQRADWVATGFQANTTDHGVTKHPTPSIVQRWLAESYDYFEKWRNQARESYRYYSPDSDGHWLKSDRAYLESLNRPVISFNRQKPQIDAVSGFESSNAQQVSYLARQPGKAGPNVIYTEGARYFRERSFADDEDADAFQDLCICGMGYTHTTMEYLDDPKGLIMEKRRTPLLHYADPRSKETNLRDRRYLIYVDFIPQNISRARFGDVVDTIQPPPSGSRTPINEMDRIRRGYHLNTGELAILKCEYWIIGKAYILNDPDTGENVTLSAEKFEALRDDMDRFGIPYVETQAKTWHTMYVCGSTELARIPHLIAMPAMNAITGYRDELEGTYLGLMESMKDPARWSNKMLSAFIEIFQRQAKGGLMYETSAVKDPEQLEMQWSDPAGAVELEDGGLHRIKERDVGQMPAAVDRILQIATTATRDVTGINLEFLGMANRDQARSLELERKQSVVVVLSRLLNNYKSFRLTGGQIMLKFMENYVPNGRLIRIRGPEGYRFEPFLKSPSYIEYDVVIDLAPDAPNLREQVWAALEPLLVPLIQAEYELPPEIIQYLPLPEQLTQAWYNRVTAPPGEEEVVQFRTQLENKQADTQEKHSRSFLNMARGREHMGKTQAIAPKTQIELFDAITRRLDALEKMVAGERQNG